MALPVCDPSTDYVFYQEDVDGGWSPFDSASELCAGGVRNGAVCVIGGQQFQIEQSCTTDEYPADFLTRTEPTTPRIACTASSPCSFTLSDSQWSQAMDWLGVALVIAYLFAFFHGYGVGDART